MSVGRVLEEDVHTDTIVGAGVIGDLPIGIQAIIRGIEEHLSFVTVESSRQLIQRSLRVGVSGKNPGDWSDIGRGLDL